MEVALASAYAVLLTLVACGFQLMARQAERDAVDPSPSAPRGAKNTELSRADPSLAHLHAAKFHRGLAFAVLICALYILVVIGVRNPTAPAVGALCLAAAPPLSLLLRALRKRSNRPDIRLN